MSAIIAWVRMLFRRAAGLLPTESGHPQAEDLAALAGAYRVWQQAFLDAGGSRAEFLECETLAQRLEVLARANLESHLSQVCSGVHTGSAKLVAWAIGQAHGQRAKDEVLARFRALRDADRARRWAAVHAIPSVQPPDMTHVAN